MNSLPDYEPFTRAELMAMGVAEVGSNVSVDRTCRFYGTRNISIGNNVRIDAYSVLSAGEGGIKLGSFIHLSAGVGIFGAGAVTVEDFTALSARVSVFSSNDDYNSGAMTNPLVPEEFRNAIDAPVLIRRHVVVGAGSVILPGVEIGVGAAVGALTLVKKDVPEFAIVAGNPMRQIGNRGRKLLEYEKQLRETLT